MENRILIIGIVFLLSFSSNIPLSTEYNVKISDEKESFSNFTNEIDWWPMFCHDAANTGYSNCNISEKNKLLWSVKTDIMSSSSPAVVDGKVYVTTGYYWDGQIHCIDLETGSFLWNYSVNDSIWVSPIVIDTFLYAAIRGGRILCLNSSTGELIWDTTVDPSVGIFEESPAFYNGKIYFACTCFEQYPENNNSGLYCLDAYNGSILWSYPTGRSIMFSPSIYNGKVYTIGLNNRLTCLDAENGNELWILPDFFIVYHPFILNDRIYVDTLQGDIAGSVLCIKDGEVLWEYYPTSNYGVTTTIVGSNNSIYFGTGTPKVADPGKVVCVNAETGKEKWSYTTTTGVRKFTNKPSLTNDYLFIMEEYVYDTTHISSSICSFDVKTGEQVWYYTISWDFDNYVYGGIAIADDKIIFNSVEYDDSGDVWGGVYCFDKFDGNLPPNPPTIIGPTNGDAGTSYPYTFISTDSDGDDVSYYIEWGDGDTTTWTEFRPSGPPGYIESHSWRKGTFVIQAKAKDTYNLESDWTTLDISIPRNKMFFNSLFQRFLQSHPNLFLFLQKLLNRFGQ